MTNRKPEGLLLSRAVRSRRGKHGGVSSCRGIDGGGFVASQTCVTNSVDALDHKGLTSSYSLHTGHPDRTELPGGSPLIGTARGSGRRVQAGPGAGGRAARSRPPGPGKPVPERPCDAFGQRVVPLHGPTTSTAREHRIILLQEARTTKVNKHRCVRAGGEPHTLAFGRVGARLSGAASRWRDRNDGPTGERRPRAGGSRAAQEMRTEGATPWTPRTCRRPSGSS